MKIYAKIGEGDKAIFALKDTIEKYHGAELQLLDSSGLPYMGSIYDAGKKVLKECSEIQELTIHLPVHSCNIEVYALSAPSLPEKYLLEAKRLCDDFGVSINILFHSVSSRYGISSVCPYVQNLAKKIGDAPMKILIENPFMVEGDGFPFLQMVKTVNDERVKACFDLTHGKIRAHIFGTEDCYDYIKTNLLKSVDEPDLPKYIHQIHFAQALNRDGFRDKKTHGVVHESVYSVKNDIDFLFSLGLQEKGYVMEIQEPDGDYNDRKCQIREIAMVEEALSDLESSKRTIYPSNVAIDDIREGDVLCVAGMDFLILEKLSNGVLCTTKSALYQNLAFDNDSNNYANSDIRKHLNHNFAKILVHEIGENGLNNVAIDLISLDGLDEYGCVEGDKVGLLTLDQYRKYSKILSKYPVGGGQWLATPYSVPSRNHATSVCFVHVDGTVEKGFCGSNYGKHARPICVFSSSIFRQA